MGRFELPSELVGDCASTVCSHIFDLKYAPKEVTKQYVFEPAEFRFPTQAELELIFS